ncbi:uncharacterized protein LOC111639253 [Centruroides sculpturatus]|uniref:uncharacterized protein LOC111639253 n=2 Tax=Centruroides sculpturatus TaxID=218467 RepID=UPI000C6EB6D0|nr:uncharacterized protein LOC111639253 [Centruroides sculpturatus]
MKPLKEDNDIVLYLSPIRNTCEICDSGFEVSNSYGAFTCDSCAHFFHLNTVYVRELFCKTWSGKCSVVNGEELCKFCRLNKCYDVGMKYEIITDNPNYMGCIVPVCEERFQINFEKNRKLALNQCLIYMEQYYYKWLNLFPTFRSLSEKQKECIRSKSCVYGAIMQLIERSLYVYRAIRLHNCFIFNVESTDILFVNLIRYLVAFRDDIRNITENVEEFYVMKLQLALRDDVVMMDTNLTVRRRSRKMLENIAKKVLKLMKESSGHSLFEGKENFQEIESLNLFRYSSDIPEYCRPYNNINFCVKI